MSNGWLHRCALALAFTTLLLILVSSIMVSESTGLAVPGWAHVGQPLHRGLAGLVAVSALALMVLSLRAGASRGVRVLSGIAVVAVFGQAGLGMAMASAGKLPAIGVLQAMLSHTLFAISGVLVALTVAGSRDDAPQVEDELRPSLRSVAWLAPVLIVLQIVLGSAYRHGSLNIFWHLTGAFLVAGALAFMGLLVATTYPKHQPLKIPAVVMVWMMLGQIVLGLVALVYRANPGETPWNPNMVWFTVGHVVLGTLTLAVSVLLAIQIRRYVREAEAGSAASFSREAVSGQPTTKTS